MSGFCTPVCIGVEKVVNLSITPEQPVPHRLHPSRGVFGRCKRFSGWGKSRIQPSAFICWIIVSELSFLHNFTYFRIIGLLLSQQLKRGMLPLYQSYLNAMWTWNTETWYDIFVFQRSLRCIPSSYKAGEGDFYVFKLVIAFLSASFHYLNCYSWLQNWASIEALLS